MSTPGPTAERAALEDLLDQIERAAASWDGAGFLAAMAGLQRFGAALATLEADPTELRLMRARLQHHLQHCQGMAATLSQALQQLQGPEPLGYGSGGSPQPAAPPGARLRQVG